MKIYFFKNESHFYPRISYTWENAEKIDLDCKLQKLKKYLTYLLAFLLFFFAFVFYQKITSYYIYFFGIYVLCLPLHEFCHALFCVITGRKVERICFFPYSHLTYKQKSDLPSAYVKPKFCVWTKTQAVLLSSFPLLLLSFIPAVLAIFISSIRVWLLFLSLVNVLLSKSDIAKTLCCLNLPRKYLHFGGLILTAKEDDKPIIIHQLSVTPKLDKIDHKCFEYFDGEFLEIAQPYETHEIRTLKQEFVKQFNLEL